MQDSFMSTHAHATAQCALDFPALLRQNDWLFMKIVSSALSYMYLLLLTGVDKHFLIILRSTKKKENLSVQKSSGKGHLNP